MRFNKKSKVFHETLFLKKIFFSVRIKNFGTKNINYILYNIKKNFRKFYDESNCFPFYFCFPKILNDFEFQKDPLNYSIIQKYEIFPIFSGEFSSFYNIIDDENLLNEIKKIRDIQTTSANKYHHYT